jgi:hypothetical protein
MWILPPSGNCESLQTADPGHRSRPLHAISLAPPPPPVSSLAPELVTCYFCGIISTEWEMCHVRRAGISGIEKRNSRKTKLMNLQRTVRTRTSRGLYRGINEFKRGPRWNLVKDENGDLPTDAHNILNRWKNYLFQLLKVYGYIYIYIYRVDRSGLENRDVKYCIIGSVIVSEDWSQPTSEQGSACCLFLAGLLFDLLLDPEDVSSMISETSVNTASRPRRRYSPKDLVCARKERRLVLFTWSCLIFDNGCWDCVIRNCTSGCCLVHRSHHPIIITTNQWPLHARDGKSFYFWVPFCSLSAGQT